MSFLGSVVTRFRNYQEEVQNSGIVAAIFNFFQGRATLFAIVFTVCGIILAFRGKLDYNYSALVVAIQGLVFAHSCKEDWHQQRMAQIQQNVNSTTVTTATTSSASGPASGPTPPMPPLPPIVPMSTPYGPVPSWPMEG